MQFFHKKLKHYLYYLLRAFVEDPRSLGLVTSQSHDMLTAHCPASGEDVP